MTEQHRPQTAGDARPPRACRRLVGLALISALCWVPAAHAGPDAPWDGAPEAREIAARGSIHGLLYSVDEDRGLAVIESEDELVELRATPQQLAGLSPDGARDFSYVRFGDAKWLADPTPLVIERGPTVEYVVGVVRAVDLREGRLSVEPAEDPPVNLQAHPQAIAGLREHQEVVVAAERIGPGLWVVAAREPDPAELIDAPGAQGPSAGLLDALRR